MKALEYNMHYITRKDGCANQEDLLLLGRRNYDQVSWRIIPDGDYLDAERNNKSLSFSHHSLAFSTTSKSEDESSRSSTPSMASEPIRCPPSPPDSEEDHHQVPLEQSIEYYNSMTWCMYYRIMNARKASRNNKKAHKKNSSVSCGPEATSRRTSEKQALGGESSAGSIHATKQGRPRGILNSQSADLAIFAHSSRASTTGQQKVNDVISTEEDIFHLDM
jgi:hypothetical protein